MTVADWNLLFLNEIEIKSFVELRIAFKKYKLFQSSPLLSLFPKMATMRNKRRLAAMSRETQENPRNNQSQNSSAPGITEQYKAQFFEEIEGRVTKKLSQDFSRTEARVVGALSKLDEFFLNPQIQTFSGTIPGQSRNASNQEPSRDRSQNDSHFEVEFSGCRASNLIDSDPDETSHMYMLSFCELKRSCCTEH